MYINIDVQSIRNLVLPCIPVTSVLPLLASVSSATSWLVLEALEAVREWPFREEVEGLRVWPLVSPALMLSAILCQKDKTTYNIAVQVKQSFKYLVQIIDIMFL